MPFFGAAVLFGSGLRFLTEGPLVAGALLLADVLLPAVGAFGVFAFV
jgi:hypothetical protein